SSAINLVSLPNLEHVNGKIEFSNLTLIQYINLEQLATVTSFILFQCAQLESLILTKGITSLSHLQISDTSLRGLNGMYIKKLVSLQIDNNKYLNYLNITTLITVKEMLSFLQNGRVKNHDGVVVAFPALQTVGDLTLQRVTHAYFSSLRNISGSLVLTLSNIERFVLANLRFIFNSLSIYNNSELNDLRFPNLISIGGTFLLQNNPKLTTISGFPNVTSIGGSVSWTGPLTNIALPRINDIKGTVLIVSSSSLSCPSFLKSPDIVQGASSVCKSSSDSKTGGTSDARKNSFVKFVGILTRYFL
ncbi:hypothetical protein PCK2_000897, partial [Pneumocystis canis]